MSNTPNKSDKTLLRELIKAEYQRCASDPAYFMRKYCYIQHMVKGRMLFNLYKYQEDALNVLSVEDNTIVLKARQLGFSTLIACFALHLMLFFRDKNVIIIATKQETAKNIITKVRFAFDNLPIWLKLKYTENNKLSLRFSNGSQIKALSATEDAARSEAVSLLVLDEAAFIKNAEEIWTGAQATLATGGKAVLISTPNGIGNFFYEKYIEAEEYKGRKKDKAFFPIKLDWTVHPERDEKWKADQLSTIKERQFRQEFEAEFLGSGNTVIDADTIVFYKKNFVQDPELRRGPNGDLWVWKQPDYTRSYIVVADVARGETSEEGDYSAFHVIDIVDNEQVAEYKGRIGTEEYGSMLVSIAIEYNKALLVIENSGIGWATIQSVINLNYPNLFYMTEDLKYIDPDQARSNRLYAKEKKALAGFTTSVRTRPLIISKLDQYMTDRSVTIRSSRTIDELLTFVWNKGKAEAVSDKFHDDLIMSLSIGLWIRDTALQLHQRTGEYTRLALDKIHRVNQVDAIFVPKKPTINPYEMQIKSGDTEDLLWLL